MIAALGGEAVNFMASQKAFPHLYVWSGVWQNLGWSSIIYLGVLSTISPEQHEAAIIDGATILQRIRYIDIPGISQTIIILLILSCGSILGVGFEKIYLMQNDLNNPVSEVISTYVYKQGILGAQYSYSAAIGFFNSIVNFAILLMVNIASRRMSDVSLF